MMCFFLLALLRFIVSVTVLLHMTSIVGMTIIVSIVVSMCFPSVETMVDFPWSFSPLSAEREKISPKASIVVYIPFTKKISECPINGIDIPETSPQIHIKLSSNIPFPRTSY